MAKKNQKSQLPAFSSKVLVIGGGVTGLSVARELSASGYPVTIVERSKEPKGPVEAGELRCRTTVRKVRGQVGNFQVEFDSPGGPKKDTFGAIVVACGLETASPLPSLKLKKSSSVALLSKASSLIDSLSEKREGPLRVAFLMDVNREQTVVTTEAVLSQARKARTKGNVVTVYGKNIRVGAPGLEKLYREARSQGVLFIKYSKPPAIKAKGRRVTVIACDEQMGIEVEAEFDLLIVADDLVADNDALKKILRLKGDKENFFQEENVWLYPVRSSRRGIFIAGACREPMSIKEAREEAAAAALEVDNLLRKKTVAFDLQVAEIDDDKCVFCLTCYRACPHGAIEMDFDKGAARVAEIACQACGICAAECPAKAIQLQNYTDDRLAAETDDPPPLLIFACAESGVKAGEAAAGNGWKLPAKSRLVEVPCAGKIDNALILKSLQKGAKRVLLLGCHQENCHYLQGSARAEKRVDEIKKRLEEAGLDPGRVEIGNLISKDGAKFANYVGSVSGKR